MPKEDEFKKELRQLLTKYEAQLVSQQLGEVEVESPLFEENVVISFLED